MKGYKHIDPKLADRFASGASIQIATYEYYRNMEGERADPLEGKVEYRVGRLEPAHFLFPEYAQARKIFGLPAEGIRPSPNLIFGDNTIRFALPPAYLFCCSTVPDERLIANGVAVFEIEALDLFAHRLTKARSDVLNGPQVREVQYENRSANPFEDPMLDGDPFKKSMAFSHENEIRIVWRPSHTSEEFLLINAPRVAPLLKRIA